MSSGFRAPNIDDVGKIRENSGILTVPNSKLKPENAYTIYGSDFCPNSILCYNDIRIYSMVITKVE